MEQVIKTLVEAITHTHTKNLIESHVTKLAFDEDSQHLIIYVDNAAPLHELDSDELDVHLNKGLVAVYGNTITYDLKLNHAGGSDRERGMGRGIHK
jgi:hypothetical protein